jgi:regulation of enolase protein 1 (concanavalin A-like superfamily)
MRWRNESPTHYGFVRDSGHFRYTTATGDFAERLLRLGALTAAPRLEVGVMAASPERGGFEAVLRGFAIEPLPAASG